VSSSCREHHREKLQIQAFAMACPVVATNAAGAQEQSGEAALLFDPSDPADMAAKIALVCRAPELSTRLKRS